MDLARIAIVGREWLTRALLRAELQEAGHDVTGYESASDVIDPLRTGLLRLDLLIIDTVGADLDADVLREVRVAVGTTPVLLVAGYNDIDRLNLAEFGFPNVVRRPVLIRSVLESAERLLGEAQQEGLSRP